MGDSRDRPRRKTTNRFQPRRSSCTIDSRFVVGVQAYLFENPNPAKGSEGFTIMVQATVSALRRGCSVTFITALVILTTTRASGQLPRWGIVHRTPLLSESAVARSVVAGDVDGDGDFDVIVGNQFAITLWINEGDGYFVDGSMQLPQGAAGAHGTRLGDVDGDGDADLVYISHTTPESLVVALNDGSGQFNNGPPMSLPPVSTILTDLALGDIDGDLDPDIVISTILGPPIAYVNDGAGGFSAAPGAFPSSGLTFGTAIALADFDNDGDTDALLGRLGQDALFLNDGSGIFTDVSSQLPPVPVTNDIALGDVDGDGDVDALLASGLIGVTLLLNDGSATFSDGTAQVPTIVSLVDSTALGDLDGDGDLDAVIATHGSNEVLINDGSGLFSLSPTAPPDHTATTVAVALADLDFDGDVDVFNANGAGEQDTVWLNDISGGFHLLESLLPRSDDSTHSIALGDVDGDGDLDALFGRMHEDYLLLNDGNGAFEISTTSGPGGLPVQAAAGPTSVTFEDVDGDGDLDALLVTPSVAVSLLINDGTGTFADGTMQIPASALGATAADFGDVDGDGDADLLLGKSFQQDVLLLNDGSGTFIDASSQVPLGALSETTSVELLDIDSDGDLDAFVRRSVGSSPPSRIWLNDGVGAFSVAANVPPNTLPWGPYAFGDVDGDGDADLIAASGATLAVHFNTGAASFTVAPGFVAGAVVGYTCIALVDLDDDGDLDMILGKGPSGPPQSDSVFLNDGSGFFSAAPNVLPTVDRFATRALAAGDFDKDGDIDILAGSDGQDRLYTNLDRHLAWHHLPRYAKPFQLNLHGPATSPWYLLASAAISVQSIPGIGLFQLDLPTTVLVAQGFLDAGGAGSVSTIAVPNPGGPPITFFLQAIVGPYPPRLTNLEPIVLSGL